MNEIYENVFGTEFTEIDAKTRCLILILASLTSVASFYHVISVSFI